MSGISLISLLLAVFYVLIVKRFMDIFFTVKREYFIKYLLWISFGLIQCFIEASNYLQPLFILLVNIVLLFGLSSASYIDILKKRCIFSIMICTLWMLVEIIIGVILNSIGFPGIREEVPGALISEICMFLFSVVANQYKSKQSSFDIPWHYATVFLLIPVMSIYMVHQIFLIANRNKEYSFFAITSGFIFLLVNYVIFSIYDWMIQNAEIKEKNKLYEQQLDLCSKQAEERESFNLEIRRLRHDLKNHLAVLQELIRTHDEKEAEIYIKSLLDSNTASNWAEISRSGNIVVDSLVNYKCTIAQKENISFIANIFVPVTLPFQIGDIVIIFGNLLENALDACREMKEGDRFIEIDVSYSKEILMIFIRNSYTGERKKDNQGRMQTSKKDLYYHGIGISSVEHAIKPYDGELLIDDSNNAFCVTVIMYGNQLDKKLT